MEKESIDGQMVGIMKVNEKKIKWMVKENFNGGMEEFMRGSMLMIRNKVMGYLYGMMGGSMKGNGKVFILLFDFTICFLDGY